MRLNLVLGTAAMLSASVAVGADSSSILTSTPDAASTMGGDGTLKISVPHSP